MNSSTEENRPPALVYSTNGKTIYDLLSGTGTKIFVIALLLIGIVAYSLFKEDIDPLLSEIGPYIEEYWPLIIPVVGGAYFGEELYYEYLRKTVILRIDRIDCGRYGAFRVTKDFFLTLSKDRNVTPFSTYSGEELYFCSKIDFDGKTVEFSRLHFSKEEGTLTPAEVIAHSDLFDKMCDATEDAIKKVVELYNAPSLKGLEFLSDQSLDLLNIIGSNKKRTEEKIKSDTDEKKEVEQDGS